jgi:hypothetical protein
MRCRSIATLGPAASIDALMAVAAYFKLDTEATVKILAEVERTVSTWRVRGRELGMSAAELEQFADAFEHRERERDRICICAIRRTTAESHIMACIFQANLGYPLGDDNQRT